MPRAQGNGLPMHPLMAAAMPFFSGANYRFSTNEEGRPSTLYFADGFGQRGRFRRGHAQGAQLIFQGRCRRVFVSPMLKGQLAALTTGGPWEDNLDAQTYRHFMQRLIAVLDAIEAGDPGGKYDGRASRVPRIGWHVFDYDGDNAHCSAGTVLSADPGAAAAVPGLAAHAGPWSVW